MAQERQTIYVAGHRGMVGSAIVRTLLANGVSAQDIITRTHAELDLCNQAAVQAFFQQQRPAQVYLAAAKVGGIYANNTYPADFIYDNLMVQANVIDAAHRSGVHKLLFLGSSCIYPRLAAQPMAEDALLTGTLEPTNEPYAIAKIAGIKMCESYNRQHGRDYRSVMPTNLYGPGANYNPDKSTANPARTRLFPEAKTKNPAEGGFWGRGQPRREFLDVEDMAAASVFVMNLPLPAYQAQTAPMQSHLNVGFGSDVTIAELARAVGQAVGYTGTITFDTSKPDGAPRKWMDSSRLYALGWQAQVDLGVGLRAAYADFVQSNPL